MSSDNFDDFIKDTSLNTAPVSQEQFENFKSFSKKKTLKTRALNTAMACCAFALIAVSANRMYVPAQENMLTEEDLVFLDETYAMETDESTNGDEDLYTYSTLITL